MKNEKKQIPPMHPRIHLCIIITCHASSNHPSYSTKSLKII